MSRIFIKWVLALSVVLATGSVGFGQQFLDADLAYSSGDYATALFIYRTKSEYRHAQFMLGAMHIEGRGVPQDSVYAHMWFNIAASDGDEDAVANRNLVAQNMTAGQIAEAQKLARECVAKKFNRC